MFFHSADCAPANIKVYRDDTTTDRIWVRLSENTRVAMSLAEAQQIAAGINRELQIEIAVAKQVQS